MTIITSEMSNDAIGMEIGHRLRDTRLRMSLTQELVAERAAIAVNTVKNLEKGKGTLSSLIAVMRVLDGLDQVNSLLPTPGVSPLMMLKQAQSKPRQRARSKKNG